HATSVDDTRCSGLSVHTLLLTVRALLLTALLLHHALEHFALLWRQLLHGLVDRLLLLWRYWHHARHHAQHAFLFFIACRDLQERGRHGTLLRFHQLERDHGCAGLVPTDHLGDKTLRAGVPEHLHDPLDVGLTIALHVLAKDSEVHEIFRSPDLRLSAVVSGQQEMLADIARHLLLTKFLDGILLVRTIFGGVTQVFHVDLNVGFGSIVEHVHHVRVA